MKYVFLFCSTAETQKGWENLSEEQRNQTYARIGQWFAENGGKVQGGNQLQPPETATMVRFEQNGHPIVTDGPFIEDNEVIGGYTEVEVADLDEALRLAKTWPGRTSVEIRPVVAR